MTAPLRKIYIAGPAVFLPDMGEAYYNKVRALLEAKNVKALIPTDNQVSGALEIRNKNIDMIRECDAIIADLSPFRCHEPDCGTAFEVGYAAALGKVLLTFSSDTRCLMEKYGNRREVDGLVVEDFGLPFNLMLHDGTPVFDSFEAAFDHYLKHHM